MEPKSSEAEKGIHELNKRLASNADSLVRYTADKSRASSMGHAVVIQHLVRMAHNTELENITAERVRITELLGWALNDIQQGNDARLGDDLSTLVKLVEDSDLATTR